MIRFILNEKEVATTLPPGMVLLDYIRYHKHLVGTKIGCREGDCGACAVLVGEVSDDYLCYKSMTSCLLPLGNAHGKHIVTVEGINFDSELNPLQKAMAEEGATQCGFCTPGFVVSLAGFCLNNNINTTKENAIASVDGNICRCTGYKSIERAAAKVAELMKSRNNEPPAVFAARRKILPHYFSTIKERLQNLMNGQLIARAAPATIVAGGTDLYVQRHDELTHAEIEFVFDNAVLKGITREGNICSMGPSVTVTDMMESAIIKEHFPAFHHYATLISSTPIRNMATIGGNFINASPIGDFTIFFLALNAQLRLVQNSDEGESIRSIALRSLYKGYKMLDKTPGEVVNKILFELPGKNSYFNFEKVSKRTNLDIASVNSAIHIKMNGNVIEEAGLSAGGVAPIPLFLRRTSEFLQGRTISEELVFEAIEKALEEISPISDARGSKEYKKLLLGQLIKAHFMRLFPPMRVETLISS
jgi:xanthine dehydrogenase small subunit